MDMPKRRDSSITCTQLQVTYTGSEALASEQVATAIHNNLDKKQKAQGLCRISLCEPKTPL